MSDPLDMLASKIDEASQRAAQSRRRAKFQTEFAALDCEKITNLSDKDLATWQANFEQDTPQWRFAEHAWQVRLLMSEIKAMQSAGNKGLWGALLGAVLGVAGSAAITFVNWWIGSH